MEDRFKISNIYVVTLIVASCSIVYELLAAHTLTMIAANTVKWYSITIGIFLAALGVGALFEERLSKRWGTWKTLFYVEIGLSIIGALAVILIFVGHVLQMYLRAHSGIPEGLFFFFAIAFVVIFMVGILTGFELPLLIKAGNAVSNNGKVTNRVLGADYLGSLCGALAFPLLLLPNLELITIGFLMSALNASVAIWLIYKYGNRAGAVAPKVVSVTLFVVMLGVAVSYLPEIQQYFLKKYYYSKVATKSWSTLFASTDELPTVFRTSSPYQKIDIIEDKEIHAGDLLINAYSTKFIEEPEYPRNLRLYLNRDFQFSSRYDEIYHEFFAHVPFIQTNKVPEEILVLGAGDGLLIKELLKYKEIRSIVHVDLDPELIRHAKTHPELSVMNNNALADPRVKTIVGDGYQYVRTLDRKYPAIFIDFPYAVDYNLAKLYSTEFFHFVREHLTDGGFAVFDATGLDEFFMPDANGQRKMDPGNDWPIFYNTLKKAGFENIIPYVSALAFNDEAAWKRMERKSPVPSVGEWGSSRYATLFQSRADHIKERDRGIGLYLATHAKALEQGFIMVVNGPSQPNMDFRDFGVKLHVLNEERYKLAFRLPFEQPSGIDLSKVNSIMRPTIPTIDILFVRKSGI